MRCERCGADLPKGASVCPTCGASVTKTELGDGENGRAAIPRHFGPTQAVVTQSLEDDPDSGDESSAVDGEGIPSWRINTLSHNNLGRDVRPRKSSSAKHSEDKPMNHRHQPRKHRRVWYWAIAVAICAVALVAAVVVLGTYELELWGGKTVPAVIGINQNEATKAVEAKGLSVQVESRPSDSGVGYVLETEPGVGSRVEAGGTVKLIVSANRTVPAVTGMTLDDARAALDDMGAQNVHITYDSSNQAAESTVLSVSPAEGSVFTSSDEITLVVAQAPTVPDVTGQSESEAVKSLGQAGLTADVNYERDMTAKAGTVLSESPRAGQRAGNDGVVQLTIANPNPTDYLHLLEYFSSTSGDLPTWLGTQGFALKVGYRNGGDRAVESFANEAGDEVTFTSTPWLAAGDQPDGSDAEDVITKGAFYDGLRVTVCEDESPEAGATQVSTQQLMSTCGFTGEVDSCSQADITMPAGLRSPRANFYCVSGESGDYVWTVLVKSTSGTKTEAVCTAGPKSLYEAQDLSQYGNSICDFVAYQEMFGSTSTTS